MSDKLRAALDERSRAIEEGLEEARRELEVLQRRERELLDLIEAAESALGRAATTSDGGERMTLHTAIAEVLRERENRWMTVRELTDAVNSRGLYRKRDLSPVEPNQVHARTNNYSELFEKDRSRVRLRLEPTNRDVVVYRDDDAGFFDWLDQHPSGYFINTDRTPNPNYLVLHHSGCPHIDRSPSVKWTKAYIKICSTSRAELEGWSTEVVGGEPTLCRHCFG
ncbi:MAG: HTH domain-containing protein [Gaiellaceae bacterium]